LLSHARQHINVAFWLQIYRGSFSVRAHAYVQGIGDSLDFLDAKFRAMHRRQLGTGKI